MILVNPVSIAQDFTIESVSKNVIHDLVAPLLKLSDLAALSQTSKRLHSMTIVPLERAWCSRREKATIGQEQWEKIGVFTKAPPLTYNIDEILKEKCPYFEGKRVYQTHLHLLLPRDLSIHGIGKLMRHLREGDNESVYKELYILADRKIGDAAVPESTWILITKEVIPNSRDASFSEQKNLLKLNYRPPNALEAITLITMHKEYLAEKDEYLLPDRPNLITTRCNESFSHGMFNSFHFSIGAFSKKGIVARSDFYEGCYLGLLAVRPLSNPIKFSYINYAIQSLTKRLRIFSRLIV